MEEKSKSVTLRALLAADLDRKANQKSLGMQLHVAFLSFHAILIQATP